MKCKICNSKNTTLYHTFSFFPVLKCLDCDVLFAKEPPKDERLDEIYGDEYYEGWKGVDHKLTTKTKEMKIYTFTSYLKMLAGLTKLKGKKILDIGCATGYLLEAAKKFGCDCYGIELSPFGAKEASKKFPGKIFNGLLEDAKYPKESFDIIMMTDLIEHVLDPNTFMKEVRRILKPDGYILLVTPDAKSWWSKILRKNWTNFKEEHLFYFSKKPLHVLADSTNLEVILEKPVSKFLSLDYIYSQFSVFPTPVLYQISRTFKFIPDILRLRPFPIGTGDYLQVLKQKTRSKVL